MTQSSDGELTPNPHNQIRQAVDAVQGQAISQMVGGISVGQLTVYLSQQPKETATATETPAVRLGENPYQGLRAFREKDGDRFFGRTTQTYDLWERFQRLHDDRATVRILPIYGPSGSGKSSLARAGLIPTLGKRLLPGRDRSQVVVLTPGTHPLEALATVLARIVTEDPIPVAKMREFQEDLMKANPLHQFEGLRRIAGAFTKIESSPLIVLVDQFEEIYTLCSDVKERHAFVENLLCAASDRSQNVSVILTMRSDFLGATQQHPRLNKLFSSQGFLVPIMQPEELAVAITEPAKRAGYELDKATVQLLLEESQGQDGALPLLQFALTQIWEGLRQGVEPAETLKKIGGVGGALASEAKRLYEGLPIDRQRIARSIFLAVIQLHDDNKATRRRAPISELIAREEDAPLVRDVIDRFSRPGVWILVTSSNEQQVEMVEVAHEALIRNWKELQEWLKEHGQALRQKRKIERSAEEWKEKKKSKDYLLQGRSLRDAREFMQAQKENADNSETLLSNSATEFVKVGIEKKRSNFLKLVSLFLVFPLIGTLIAVHLHIISKANSILSRDDCTPDPGIKEMLEYMWWTRYANRLRDLKLCNEDLRGIKLPRAIVADSKFEASNLSNAILQDAMITDSNFRGAALVYTDFSGANLSSADFQYSKILATSTSSGTEKPKYTRLIGTNFEGAILIGAKFQHSFLKDAKFREANLTEANFDKANDLTLQQLEGAILCKTILPQYIDRSYRNRDCPSS